MKIDCSELMQTCSMPVYRTETTSERFR